MKYVERVSSVSSRALIATPHGCLKVIVYFELQEKWQPAGILNFSWEYHSTGDRWTITKNRSIPLITLSLTDFTFFSLISSQRKTIDTTERNLQNYGLDGKGEDD